MKMCTSLSAGWVRLELLYVQYVCAASTPTLYFVSRNSDCFWRTGRWRRDVFEDTGRQCLERPRHSSLTPIKFPSHQPFPDGVALLTFGLYAELFISYPISYSRPSYHRAKDHYNDGADMLAAPTNPPMLTAALDVTITSTGYFHCITRAQTRQ